MLLSPSMAQAVHQENVQNNCFNLTCPLSRFVHLATLGHAQTAPIRYAERAAQVKRMLEGPCGRQKMKYKEYAPTFKLRNYIKCIWVLDYNVDFNTKIQFLPDGYFDLLFVFKNNELDKIRLIGICDYSDIIEYSTREVIIGIRMQLMAIKTVINIPINELVNTSTLLSTIELGLSIDKINRAFRHGNFIEYIQTYLLERYKPNKNEEFFYYIDNLPNTVNMIASKTGYSKRHIQRIFNSELGVSPKTYLEIIRLRNYLLQYSNEYYDDSHKIRDFKKYIGSTPTMLKQSNVRFVQYSSFFAHYTWI